MLRVPVDQHEHPGRRNARLRRTAYAARLKTGASPKDVVFMGESAGGTLVLSLALLRRKRDFPSRSVGVSLPLCDAG